MIFHCTNNEYIYFILETHQFFFFLCCVRFTFAARACWGFFATFSHSQMVISVKTSHFFFLRISQLCLCKRPNANPAWKSKNKNEGTHTHSKYFSFGHKMRSYKSYFHFEYVLLWWFFISSPARLTLPIGDAVFVCRLCCILSLIFSRFTVPIPVDIVYRPSNYVWNIVHVKQIFIMYLCICQWTCEFISI